jgi:hypothetical protein
MHPKMLFLAQVGDQSIGYDAISNLYSGFILNDPGKIPAYRLDDVILAGNGELSPITSRPKLT